MKKPPGWHPGTEQEGELPLVTATSLGSAENHTELHWEPPGILLVLPLGHPGGDMVSSSVA